MDFMFALAHKLDYKHILEDAGVKNPVECMSWAFGKNWTTLGVKQAIDRWHSRHGATFPLHGGEDYKTLLKKIGVAFIHFDKEPFLKVEHLYDLNKLEATFRRIMVKSFKLEGIHELNEMMDCISWGLNYDKDLLHCHSYWKWPDEFYKNTGILVNSRDPVTKCIRLLARKWKSKRKFSVTRAKVGA